MREGIMAFPIDLEALTMRTTSRLFTVAMIAMLFVMPTMVKAAPPTGDDAMDKSRLEKMLADGDDGMIMQVFKRYPSRTLPFIDQYFEGGLAMIEKGEDQANANAEFRKGIKFAAIADKAFIVQAFSEYANSFASWSPSEQKAFREGQRLFKKTRKEQDPAQIRKQLERSREIAESLGDGWGVVMASVALAEQLTAAGENKQAIELVKSVAQLAADLRLNEDCAKAYRIAGAAAMKTEYPTSGVSYLAQAWEIVRTDRTIDAEFRAETLQEYLAILDVSEMKAQADALRKEYISTTTDAEPDATPE